jgi:hypothetical protein
MKTTTAPTISHTLGAWACVSCSSSLNYAAAGSREGLLLRFVNLAAHPQAMQQFEPPRQWLVSSRSFLHAVRSKWPQNMVRALHQQGSQVPVPFASTLLTFFIAGLLYPLRFERIDNLGACGIPSHPI